MSLVSQLHQTSLSWVNKIVIRGMLTYRRRNWMQTAEYSIFKEVVIKDWSKIGNPKEGEHISNGI